MNGVDDIGLDRLFQIKVEIRDYDNLMILGNDERKYEKNANSAILEGVLVIHFRLYPSQQSVCSWGNWRVMSDLIYLLNPSSSCSSRRLISLPASSMRPSF